MLLVHDPNAPVTTSFPLIPLKGTMNIDMMTASKEPQAQIQQGGGNPE